MDCTAITNINNKIFTLTSMLDRLREWRDLNKRIVFTNGVFDILHIGHVTYLAHASELGHKLVLGLNSDGSVKRLKGNDRPINTQSNRAQLLAALAFVDAVIIFDEDTPQQIIKAVKPDVLVKGADYNISSIVGAREVMENGGIVKTIDIVDGHSSTRLINKLSLR